MLFFYQFILCLFFLPFDFSRCFTWNFFYLAVHSHVYINPITYSYSPLLCFKASSSTGPSNSKLINHFIGMGFSEKMVVKAIEQDGKSTLLLHFDHSFYLESLIYNALLINVQGKETQIPYWSISSHTRWVTLPSFRHCSWFNCDMISYYVDDTVMFGLPSSDGFSWCG